MQEEGFFINIKCSYDETDIYKIFCNFPLEDVMNILAKALLY